MREVNESRRHLETLTVIIIISLATKRTIVSLSQGL